MKMKKWFQIHKQKFVLAIVGLLIAALALGPVAAFFM